MDCCFSSVVCEEICDGYGRDGSRPRDVKRTTPTCKMVAQEGRFSFLLKDEERLAMSSGKTPAEYHVTLPQRKRTCQFLHVSQPAQGRQREALPPSISIFRILNPRRIHRAGSFLILCTLVGLEMSSTFCHHPPRGVKGEYLLAKRMASQRVLRIKMVFGVPLRVSGFMGGMQGMCKWALGIMGEQK